MNGNFPVEGMTCAACAVSLETYLKSSLPLHSIAVNYTTQSVAINFDESLVTLAKIQEKAEDIGYKIIGIQDSSESILYQKNKEKSDHLQLKRRFWIGVVFTLPIFIISMFFMDIIPAEHTLLLALSLPVIFYSGKPFYISAWKKIKHKQTNMDTLVALSTGIAFGYSTIITLLEFLNPHLHYHVYFESATVIITLILLGKYLEEIAKQSTSASIRELLQLQPQIANVIRNGETISLPIKEIIPGDLIITLPGDVIPVDGKIKQGIAHINESNLSGEAIPVSKTKGDKVYASTINLDGTLKIIALATPTALIVGIGEGAKKGILFKDAEALENLHRTTDVVFDKTGTLTAGAPTVINHWLNTSINPIDWTALLLAETQSNHPIAKAVVAFITPQLPNTDPEVLEELREIPGKGLQINYKKTNYKVGSIGWIQELNIAINKDQNNFITSQIDQGLTLVFFIRGRQLEALETMEILAIFSISDKIKPDAHTSLNALKSLGITTHLLTGDTQQSADSVALQLQILHTKAKALPQEKLTYIQNLQKTKKFVTMVGDGINDAPSLAQANVGVAMGAGTPVAIETAQITLRNSELNQFIQAIILSKKTFSTINQNLFWAFFYNLLAIPIAAGVLIPINGFVLNPMIAGAAMSFSSLSVLGNSLFLKFKIKQLLKPSKFA